MFTKHRNVSPEIGAWTSLHARMDLSREDRQYFMSMVKGFEGEKHFDEWLYRLPSDTLILNDLILEVNQQIIQCDSLVITGKEVMLFEVKNYEGDFYVEDECWFSTSGLEIRNPLHQLKRSESLLATLLQKERFSFSVTAYLVFVHPEFVLLQAPRDVSIIFPGQLPRFFQRLKKEAKPLTQKHHQLAERLLTLHMDESPYHKLPAYSYNRLKKGILCPSCFAFFQLHHQRLVCPTCSYRIQASTGVIESVKEFQWLFPEKKITTPHIHDWVGGTVSKKVIRTCLKKHFFMLSQGRGVHYVARNEK
ncbi:nuclease-related domain-containing protein [Alteribacillus iranensis]|uniref:Nuclease-related domain-containing protein n=1 Tax=Alteribacillus iranensis TaxID=930128 RepID=A0A1I2C224_9BACI|nr:nuclease-related domain-containing protein [Alteribacillus iranensis]SFE61793.1 Nuclease-related domain-containing protein [Alteribacillus iranensis]